MKETELIKAIRKEHLELRHELVELKQELDRITKERDKFLYEWSQSLNILNTTKTELKVCLEYQNSLLNRIDKIKARWNSMVLNSIGSLAIPIE